MFIINLSVIKSSAELEQQFASIPKEENTISIEGEDSNSQFTLALTHLKTGGKHIGVLKLDKLNFTSLTMFHLICLFGIPDNITSLYLQQAQLTHLQSLNTYQFNVIKKRFNKLTTLTLIADELQELIFANKEIATLIERKVVVKTPYKPNLENIKLMTTSAIDALIATIPDDQDAIDLSGQKFGFDDLIYFEHILKKKPASLDKLNLQSIDLVAMGCANLIGFDKLLPYFKVVSFSKKEIERYFSASVDFTYREMVIAHWTASLEDMEQIELVDEQQVKIFSGKEFLAYINTINPPKPTLDHNRKTALHIGVIQAALDKFHSNDNTQSIQSQVLSVDISPKNDQTDVQNFVKSSISPDLIGNNDNELKIKLSYAYATTGKGRWYHYYKVVRPNQPEGKSGDALKTEILQQFFIKINQCTDRNSLDTTWEEIKGHPDYAILKTKQGLCSRFFGMKTDSITALKNRYAEKLGEFSKTLDL